MSEVKKNSISAVSVVKKNRLSPESMVKWNCINQPIVQAKVLTPVPQRVFNNDLGDIIYHKDPKSLS